MICEQFYGMIKKQRQLIVLLSLVLVIDKPGGPVFRLLIYEYGQFTLLVILIAVEEMNRVVHHEFSIQNKSLNILVLHFIY